LLFNIFCDSWLTSISQPQLGLLWRCRAAPLALPDALRAAPECSWTPFRCLLGRPFGKGSKRDFDRRPDEGCPSALLSKVPLDPSLERGPAGLWTGGQLRGAHLRSCQKSLWTHSGKVVWCWCGCGLGL
jgi:hypothetical protein